MKLRLLSFSLCAMLLTAGAFFTGCTNTTTPGTSTTGYNDTYADMPGLSLGTTYKFNITGGASGSRITGVSAYSTGTVRVFWSRAAGDSSQITPVSSSSASDAITWAPASLTSMVRLYETADPSDNSGLILGATSTTSLLSGAGRPNIDLVLATIPGATLPDAVLSLQAADIAGGVGTGGKMTDIANAHRVAGGLAMDIETASATTDFPSGGTRFLDLPYHDYKDTSIVLYAKTADAIPRFARIEIVPQPTSSTTAGYLWGDTKTTGGFRFIDMNITYESVASSGFVGRPGITRRATTPTEKVGRGLIIN